MCQAWLCVSVVPTTQEAEAGECDLKASLDYTVRLCLKNRNRNKTSPRDTIKKSTPPNRGVLAPLCRTETVKQRSEELVPLVQTPNKPNWVNIDAETATLPIRVAKVVLEKAAHG